MHFAHPEYLWFLLILIPYIVWYVLTVRRRYASLGVSTTMPFSRLPRTFKQYGLYILFALRLLAIASLIVVIARPQEDIKWATSNINGTDIVLTLDISSSMLAQDFEPDRLGAAKSVATKFINGRENDNIGLVVFADESFTAVPMTTDHALLINYLREIEIGMLGENATAIGDGLASAINRIREGKAKSKSIILLTDGSNNSGIVNPINAAEIAKKFGIKIYTIGIGTYGEAEFPTAYGTTTRIPVTIDEDALRTIASITDGKYFRANNQSVLKSIFEEINKLETTTMDVRKFAQKEDVYLPWALLAFALLALELIGRNLFFRNIP